VIAYKEDQGRGKDFQDFTKEHCGGIEEFITLKELIQSIKNKNLF
jgi:hypothetical protein